MVVAGRALVVASLLFAAAAVVGRLGSELVWAERLLDHPIALGVLAAACGTAGVVLVVPWLWLRVVVVIVGAPVTILGAVFGTWMHYWWQEPELESHPAPDGRGTPYEVVVRSSNAAVIDPAWELQIRQTAGIGARQWELGCLNGDSPDQGYDHVRWRDRSHLVVTTHGGAVITVTVDPRSGEPLDTTGAPWTC